MKAKLLFSIFFLVACVSVYAQDSTKLTKVFLQDGTTFSAYVEKQVDGGYKLTTEDGSIFFFREGEISLDKPFKKSAKNTKARPAVQNRETKQLADQGQSQNIPIQGLKYRDLKLMYSARDYRPERGDMYSPTLVGIGSFLLPGFGQYLTGSQIGWGLLQSFVSGASLGIMIDCIDYGEEWGVPFLIWAGTAIWSACSASKAAKIKNLYYRDLRNGVAYKFDFTPYVDATAPVLASNQNIVAGLSFRVSF